eukprot:CAMPEP_0168362162 /NCGR_PEP_ID=MMETSP0228-20121227/3034_1 /TAXON_ID=133427 /ORGANISM="Protoceratium reticulatum, Strain CCCM 535 (=CCMP 1889)" /LENGTH=393 /DNA_ID=CAMNT_0008374851 /DNA_START=56 /DNA_END=1237 /DNA_ORIENTATION=-
MTTQAAPRSSVSIPCLALDAIRASNARGDDSLAAQVDEAFGPSGPGVLCVAGGEVRERVSRIRTELLPRAVALSELPGAGERLRDPETPLTNGLSRGAESTDCAKSSFYFHPLADAPAEHLPAGAPRVAAFHNPNLWPAEEELPGFKAAARGAAQFVVGVGHELAQVIDRRLVRVPGYTKGALAAAVRRGPDSNHKCRLIRYHPYESEREVEQTGGMWAAPHLDTGSLTGLVPGVYVDAGGAVTANPDPGMGLYIQDRSGAPLKVEMSVDANEALLFQIGESLQIISGGELQATPHYVKGPSAADPGGASRCSLAIFMQPQPHEELAPPDGMLPTDIAARSADRHLPPQWPSLEQRLGQLQEEGFLSPGKPFTFGDLGRVTLSNLGALAGDQF